MREGEVSDVRRRMEELSAVGQVATEEIGRLKQDLSREVTAFDQSHILHIYYHIIIFII